MGRSTGNATRTGGDVPGNDQIASAAVLAVLIAAHRMAGSEVSVDCGEEVAVDRRSQRDCVVDDVGHPTANGAGGHDIDTPRDHIFERVCDLLDRDETAGQQDHDKECRRQQPAPSLD